MTDRWTELLSDYLDGELGAGEQAALEAHLPTCADCRAVLADLRRVVERAQVADRRGPDRDLWPGIAARIGAGAPAGRGIAARRWSFSLPQLAAAAVLLMTLSGGTVWLINAPGRAPASPTAGLVSPATGAPAAINAGTRASRSYADAVADLERVLAGGQAQLDTATVRVIQENLAAIDRAIAQAQGALAADPANLYLNTHLAQTMRRKLDLLRHAATLVQAS